MPAEEVFSMDRWLLLALTVCLSAPALARVVQQTAPLERAAPLATMQRGQVTLAQAKALALRRFPGRVVRADTVARGGRREYHIRILGDDGRVRTVRVDAQSGRVF
jgi:uncharacterized membrane protein YkoI